MAKGKIYKVVKKGITTKQEATSIANAMRRKGYARVSIIKKGKKYNIWAFC